MMNLERFIQLTKEYLSDRLTTYSRGDLHIMPHAGREELLQYIRSFHSRFPRARFTRFIEKMKNRGFILESNDNTLVFDPVFPY